MVQLNIEIDGAGWEAARRKLDPEVVNRAQEAAMNESLAYLQGQVQEGTPVDQGILRGNIFTAIRGQGVDMRGVVYAGPQAKHALSMERGRRAGVFPPVAAIEAWARRHGMAGLGFIIARAISKRRSPKDHPDGYRMFENASTKGKPTVERIFARHLARLMGGR